MPLYLIWGNHAVTPGNLPYMISYHVVTPMYLICENYGLVTLMFPTYGEGAVPPPVFMWGTSRLYAHVPQD